VARLGRIDPRGVAAGTRDAQRSVAYITKYVTKDLIDHARPTSDPQQAHADRLHAALSTLPCSPTCANWLLYGVQPDHAKAGLVPGRCKGKVHQPTTLGFTGRRVLISRQWSNKTLTDHRADNRDWIRAVLAMGQPDSDEQEDQADTLPTQREDQPDTDPGRRYTFYPVKPGDPDLPSLQHRILRAISARQQWRDELLAARRRAAGPAGLSATPHHHAPPTVSATPAALAA
jgi:hypothetical protein